ncbi:aminodeoxychorismate/anthranilate synthase component II [Streptomyces radicis]|uniref:Aminodeoxychorismate synthase n=1 Tax=Streptomyces radicis TaxID=1750517 RepID=A0A3A9W3E6_9ACTN|nr:aminodeoxychorismate/anthranilate synthase component II [Streptomyces radicis]RKN07272.1 aminodeoxychorismate/anthranilate synthase component II [Streptomyces radicis]RKN26711.1 aminodeoxychorismate/anthranilate synthase component II [Streptomyces radicis]
MSRTRVLVVDNYDSFVYNLVQYLYQLGAECEVLRNDAVRPERVQQGGFAGVLLSPGPGTPERAGVSVEMVTHCAATRTPVFGVCLGMQAMAVAYGGVVGRAPELLHGKTSDIRHTGEGVFDGLPTPLTVTRYHSLAAEEPTLPEELRVTAWAGEVPMALRHRELPVEGVQFHPESVLTRGGHRMLANWLAVCGDPDAVARSHGLAPVVESAA